MRIQLSEHFTYRKLLRFTLPSVIMMVCASIYGVVDGVFVSNFVGSDAFAAVNLIMPFLMVLGAVGFMLGTGGSALVAYTLGAGNEKRANEIFSLLIYVLIGLGAVFTIGGIAFLTPMSRLLGADETMLPVCVSYGRIVLLGLYGVIMYVNFIFIAIFLGYSMGSAPSWAITTAPGTGWSCGGCCGRACASLPS